MAESTLSVDINSLRLDVALFLGWPRSISSWSATQLSDFDTIAKGALRVFYFPPISPQQPYYEWSFMRKTGTITLATDDFDYDLPDDFSGTILDDSVSWGQDEDKRKLKKIPESDLRQLRSMDDQSNEPKYYSVRNKAHDPTAGQRWEFLVYPTPRAAENTKVITFRYAYVPDTISNTNIYPVGGAQYGEVIREAFLAQSENVFEDDNQGVHNRKFAEMLTTAIRNDEERKANNRGGSV